MLCNTNVCSLIIALSKIIDSRIRTPAPIFTFAPIETFGPNYDNIKKFDENLFFHFDKDIQSYRGCWMDCCRWMNKNITNNIANQRITINTVIRSTDSWFC